MYKVRFSRRLLTSDAISFFLSIPQGARRHHHPDDRRPTPVEDGVQPAGCKFQLCMIWTRSAWCT